MNINALDREQPSHYLLLNHAESGKSQACLKLWNLIGVKFWYSICHGECETVIPETVIPETVIPFPGEQVAEDYTLVSVSGSEQTINAMATSDSSGSLQYIYIYVTAVCQHCPVYMNTGNFTAYFAFFFLQHPHSYQCRKTPRLVSMALNLIYLDHNYKWIWFIPGSETTETVRATQEHASHNVQGVSEPFRSFVILFLNQGHIQYSRSLSEIHTMLHELKRLREEREELQS